MRKRDPDELTDREREVLALLRRDFTNEQIAQRLGISLDGAKYHVSQILSKLGVATREEAASVALGERRWWWAAWPLWGKIAAAGAASAAIAGGTAAGWGVLASDGADEELPPQVSPTPTARPVPAIGDHWHAAYAVFIGAARQSAIPEFDSAQGIHTHGDGVVHVHPFTLEGEGAGSSLGAFFQAVGGELTEQSLRLPGSDTIFLDGDPVPGSEEPGGIRIIRESSGMAAPVAEFAAFIAACDGLAGSEFEEVAPDYIPHDGDCIRILFTPN